VEVSPVAPVYFRFEFDPSPNADSVLVTVQDPVCMDPQDVQDGTCLIFSIQQPHVAFLQNYNLNIFKRIKLIYCWKNVSEIFKSFFLSVPSWTKNSTSNSEVIGKA